ncbi:MAG: xanthine dehydrogenase family protein molybdopterin-binding subunit [Chloroflexi bacterium]|nr:xanthine dehydrogenase family protein molybdopterin-binding subunit [Chloroflexota bacterium]
MTTANQVLSEVEFEVVGTRPVRPDGVDKVTGRAQYGADLDLTGMLQARVLRSPHAHARIKSIDTSRAEALDGVRAVVTAADLPLAALSREDLGNDYNRFKFLSDNFLASDKALYRGHAVAAVAADNAHIAEAALSLISVDYEVLEPVIDVRAAMQDGAPLLHDDLIHTSAMGEVSDQPSNVASYMKFEKGDTAAGFANSDVIVEREFSTASVHQGYIEPHNATAHWRADGQINVWCSTQGAFVVRANTADVLRVDVSNVRVTPMEIGGGFGGKVTFYLEPVAALLSRKAGAPVKLLMTRTEVFEGSGPAPGSWMRVKMGANSAGKITAAEIELAFEAGAYPGSPVMQGATCAFACYELENGTIEGYDVVVNKPKTAAYRAPGSPQAAFGVEQVVDEVCQKLGVDPVEFRLNNAVTEGSRKVEGPVFQKIGLVECLEAARNHEHYRTPLAGPNRGRGIAAGFWMNRGFHSSVNMTVNPDGTVNLIEGSVDIGGSRASIAQQAAETLGISYEEIKPQVVDTDSIGFTMVTGGSRTTFATGWAAILAAEDVKGQMVERAASIWDVPAEEVEYEDGIIRHKSEELSFTFKDLARQLYTTGGGITGTASLDPTGEGNSFGVHLVDVEVDPETGKTEILRYTAIQDAGKAVHPSYVEGQIQGGAVQGIGWALNEEYYFSDNGQMMNSSFLDYRMPTSLDLPMIDTVIVEVANPGHPYGVRGVGEVPIVPPLAAVANAVGHATDQRLTSLPITPGSILEATL